MPASHQYGLLLNRTRYPNSIHPADPDPSSMHAAPRSTPSPLSYSHQFHHAVLSCMRLFDPLADINCHSCSWVAVVAAAGGLSLWWWSLSLSLCVCVWGVRSGFVQGRADRDERRTAVLCPDVPGVVQVGHLGPADRRWPRRPQLGRGCQARGAQRPQTGRRGEFKA